MTASDAIFRIGNHFLKRFGHRRNGNVLISPDAEVRALDVISPGIEGRAMALLFAGIDVRSLPVISPGIKAADDAEF